MSTEYSPFKMKGHELPGPNQRASSPVKQHEGEGIEPDRVSKMKLMKEAKPLEKKDQAENWNKKLTRMDKRRTKLREKQTRREEKGKSTERVERKEARLQKRINKEMSKVNPKTPNGTDTPMPAPAPKLPNPRHEFKRDWEPGRIPG